MSFKFIAQEMYDLSREKGAGDRLRNPRSFYERGFLLAKYIAQDFPENLTTFLTHFNCANRAFSAKLRKC